MRRSPNYDTYAFAKGAQTSDLALAFFNETVSELQKMRAVSEFYAWGFSSVGGSNSFRKPIGIQEIGFPATQDEFQQREYVKGALLAVEYVNYGRSGFSNDFRTLNRAFLYNPTKIAHVHWFALHDLLGFPRLFDEIGLIQGTGAPREAMLQYVSSATAPQYFPVQRSCP